MTDSDSDDMMKQATAEKRAQLRKRQSSDEEDEVNQKNISIPQKNTMEIANEPLKNQNSSEKPKMANSFKEPQEVVITSSSKFEPTKFNDESKLTDLKSIENRNDYFSKKKFDENQNEGNFKSSQVQSFSTQKGFVSSQGGSNQFSNNNNPNSNRFGNNERFSNNDNKGFGNNNDNNRGIPGEDGRGFGGDNRRFGNDNRGFGGDNRRFGGDNRRFGGDNRGFGGDNRGFGGDNRGFGGDNKGFDGDNRGFGGDNRGFGGDNRGFGGGGNRDFNRGNRVGRGGYNRDYRGDNRPFNNDMRNNMNRDNQFNFNSETRRQGHIEDYQYYKDRKEVIDDIIKVFHDLDENKVIEVLKTAALNNSILIFELLNEFARENIIQRHQHDQGRRKYNDRILIFETADIRDILPSHEFMIKEYKTLPMKDGNKESNYEDDRDRRRKILKDVNGFYNYLPVECSQVHEKANDECLFSHNDNERYYHSLTYHTRLCIKSQCANTNEKCPDSHGIFDQFRRIYDYRKKEIIELIVKLENDEKLKGMLQSYMAHIPIPSSFSLDTFKVLPCKLAGMCGQDSHLCLNYHDIKERRRPPKLFKLANEVCSMAQPEKDSEYYPNLCPRGIHCDKIHTRYELLYHPENFRKIRVCTRPKEKGRCKFIQTCYGIHPEDMKEGNENAVIAGSFQEDDLKSELQKKIEECEKYENIINKALKCKVCEKIPDKFKYCQTKCKHIICELCTRQMLENEKKCLICGDGIEKGSLVKISLTGEDESKTTKKKKKTKTTSGGLSNQDPSDL